MPKRKRKKEDRSKNDVKASKKFLIGYRGVAKSGNRFKATFSIGGNAHYLGTFDTTKEAAIAWDLAAIQAKLPKSELNFPDMNHVEVEKKIQKRKKRKMMKSSNETSFNGQITVDDKSQHLGIFDTPKEAAQAHDLAAIQAGHPTSKLNFLDQVPKNYKPKNNGLYSTNTIGYRGVYKNKNRFKATICIDGRQHNIGQFGTTKEAAIAYDLAAIQAKRPRSDLNFPFLHDGEIDIIP